MPTETASPATASDKPLDEPVGTDPVGASRWHALAVCGGVVLLVGWLGWVKSRHGFKSPDSEHYLAAARSIAEGRRVLDRYGNPMSLFPPGYPVVLATLSRLCSLETAARVGQYRVADDDRGMHKLVDLARVSAMAGCCGGWLVGREHVADVARVVCLERIVVHCARDGWADHLLVGALRAETRLTRFQWRCYRLRGKHALLGIDHRYRRCSDRRGRMEWSVVAAFSRAGDIPRSRRAPCSRLVGSESSTGRSVVRAPGWVCADA